MCESEFHDQLDALNHTNWHVKAIVHCLIDLGAIERLECQYENCILDTREFRPRKGGRGHEAYSLAVDHIDPQMSGGTHRPENLRPIHASCNVSRGLRKESPETTQKRREARAAFLASDRTEHWRSRMKERPQGWNKAASETDRRGGRPGVRGGVTALTPDQVSELRARQSAGETIKALAEELKISFSTAHKAIRGKGPYSDI
ncbi:HNH endonuclease [Streptomyces sp. NPDC059071]|uniref:HNH endonuclease n=1 Tax=unclassified Streptomyces TaxID=2593676 RepID=UPI00365BDCA8